MNTINKKVPNLSNRKATYIFLFLFVIPYLFALVLIGTCYNALLVHTGSWWRTIVGALIGAVLLMLVKITVERPLKILGKYTTIRFIHLSIRFFMLEKAKWWKLSFNFILDFILAGIATWAVRHVFIHAFITGTMVGWLILIMFISILLGSYLDFDLMSIAPLAKHKILNKK